MDKLELTFKVPEDEQTASWEKGEMVFSAVVLGATLAMALMMAVLVVRMNALLAMIV